MERKSGVTIIGLLGALLALGVLKKTAEVANPMFVAFSERYCCEK
jgi:hypothetical protein